MKIIKNCIFEIVHRICKKKIELDNLVHIVKKGNTDQRIENNQSLHLINLEKKTE